MKNEMIVAKFRSLYPDLFEDEAWKIRAKKHDDQKIIEYFQQNVTANVIKEAIIEKTETEYLHNFAKFLQKSAVISTFERIAMQNYFQRKEIHQDFLLNLLNLVNDYNETTFNNMVTVMAAFKDDGINANIAKWPVISMICYYLYEDCYPLKPTNAKKISQLLNYDIDYKSYPNYETYEKNNKMFLKFKKEVNLDLTKKQVHSLLYVVVNSD